MPAPKGHEPYNENGEGGRPVKWTPEAIEKEAEALEQWVKQPTSIWFEKFAFEREFPIEYLSRWAQENKRFNQAYTRAKDWQKIRLIEGGLLNKTNPKITTLLLSHAFSVHEQNNIHQTGEVTTKVINYGDNPNPQPWQNPDDKKKEEQKVPDEKPVQ
jgi:hypothetical protein